METGMETVIKPPNGFQFWVCGTYTGFHGNHSRRIHSHAGLIWFPPMETVSRETETETGGNQRHLTGSSPFRENAAT